MNFAIGTLRFIAFLFIAILSFGTIAVYITFKNDTHFLHLKQSAVNTGWYLPFFYCHIFGSSLILLAGFFQFLKSVYRNRPLHRKLGKLYVFGVLFLAAPGAYLMTCFIGRGTGVFISFILQNTLWVVTTIMAWVLIKKGDTGGHIRMMHYSYSLAFGAVMLRFYIWLFTLIGVSTHFPNNYLIIAFLSWLPNLFVAEVVLYYQRKKELYAEFKKPD